jgi:hypothetical protein
MNSNGILRLIVMKRTKTFLKEAAVFLRLKMSDLELTKRESWKK